MEGGQPVFVSKQAAGEETHNGLHAAADPQPLDAVADLLPPDADEEGGVAALAFAPPPLLMKADNVVGQPHQFGPAEEGGKTDRAEPTHKSASDREDDDKYSEEESEKQLEHGDDTERDEDGGKADRAEPSHKSAAELEDDDKYSDEESKNKREHGDDAEREENDGGCIRTAARWAVGLVGIGATLAVYAAGRARYQPFHGGALQRDCDATTTAAIPDAAYCLLDGPNVPLDSMSLPYQELQSGNPESHAGYEMDWEKFIPRGGTATAVASTPAGLSDRSNLPMEPMALLFQELESRNTESRSEIEKAPESKDSTSNTQVYGYYEIGWKASIPRGGTATAVASTPAVLLDRSNVPKEPMALPFQELESGNLESRSEIGRFGETGENKWDWDLNHTLEEIEKAPESEDSSSTTQVYGDYEMGWKTSIPRGGTTTAVASNTPVEEDLSYGRHVTIVALFVAAIALLLALAMPILMHYM